MYMYVRPNSTKSPGVPELNKRAEVLKCLSYTQWPYHREQLPGKKLDVRTHIFITNNLFLRYGSWNRHSPGDPETGPKNAPEHLSTYMRWLADPGGSATNER